MASQKTPNDTWYSAVSDIFDNMSKRFVAAIDKWDATIPELTKAFAKIWFDIDFNDLTSLIKKGLDDIEKDKKEFDDKPRGDKKSDIQKAAEKRLAKINEELQNLDRWGISGDWKKKLLEEKKEQEQIIENEKQGRGIGNSGQPVVRSASEYHDTAAEVWKWAGDNPEKQKEAGKAEELAYLAGLFHENKGMFFDGNDPRNEGKAITATAQEQQKRFDELRTQAYINRGLPEKGAKQLVQTENRNTRAEYIRKDIAQGKERIAELKEDRSKLPKQDFEGRGAVTAQIREIEKDNRNSQRGLDKLFEKEKRQRGGKAIDPDFLDRIFKSTMTMGTFSAYDILRGGGDKRDLLLDEVQRQTGILESIEEGVNQGMAP
jgi:hypothetical protein